MFLKICDDVKEDNKLLN